MESRRPQSVYSDHDGPGVAFGINADGHYYMIETSTGWLSQTEDARSSTRLDSGCSVAGGGSSIWISCFGNTSIGTGRDRQRRALVIASTQALIDLLNQP